MNYTNKFKVPACIFPGFLLKYKRITYFALPLFLIIAGFTSCTREEDKPATIHGVIFDRVTGAPVRNAQVSATEWRFSDLMGLSSPKNAGMVFSDAIGHFSFDFIPVSRYEYSISVSKELYFPEYELFLDDPLSRLSLDLYPEGYVRTQIFRKTLSPSEGYIEISYMPVENNIPVYSAPLHGFSGYLSFADTTIITTIIGGITNYIQISLILDYASETPVFEVRDSSFISLRHDTVDLKVFF